MEKVYRPLIYDFFFHQLLVKYIQKQYEGNKIIACLNEPKSCTLANLFLFLKLLFSRDLIHRSSPSLVPLYYHNKRNLKSKRRMGK